MTTKPFDSGKEFRQERWDPKQIEEIERAKEEQQRREREQDQERQQRSGSR
jgi:hypothetical protein